MGSAGRLVAELRRRKVIRVAVAYGVVAWIVVQVAESVFEPLQLPHWTLTLVVVLAILGFPLAVALAWALELTPQGLRRETAAGVLVTAPPPAPQAPALETSTEPPQASVAVLPFVDMSEAQDQGYFCDGVAEEILNTLTQVRGLNVAARTSSFLFTLRSTMTPLTGLDGAVTEVPLGATENGLCLGQIALACKVAALPTATLATAVS